MIPSCTVRYGTVGTSFYLRCSKASSCVGWVSSSVDMLRALGGLTRRTLYSLSAHQNRAEKRAGAVASKYRWTKGKPRVDKCFVEPERAWILVDAYSQPMGRLASKIVSLLQGKHKPTWQRHRDVGDYVVIVNSAFVAVANKSMMTARYYTHSRYPGALKTTPLWKLFEKNPIEPLRRAIWGMLPKDRMRRQRMTRLRMYPGAQHKQEATLRAADGLAFRARFPPGDRPAVLERIAPIAEVRDTP